MNELRLATKGIRHKEEGRRKKFKGNCNLYGRQGHKKENCWEDSNNSHRRPKRWKTILKNSDTEDEPADQANTTKDECPLCSKLGHGIDGCFYNLFNPNNKFKDPELCQPCIKGEDEDNDSDDNEVRFTALSVLKTLDWTKQEAPNNFKALLANQVERKELALNFPDMSNKDIQKHVWLTESGSSTYIYTQDVGFSNCHANKTKVEVGEGSEAPKIGKWHGVAINRKTGKKLKVCLNKTLLVPGIMHNLFSLTQAMNSRCNFYSHNNSIRVDLPNSIGTIDFNKKIKTHNGFFLDGILKLAEPKTTKQEVAMTVRISKRGKTSFKTCHELTSTTKTLKKQPRSLASQLQVLQRTVVTVLSLKQSRKQLTTTGQNCMFLLKTQ